MESLTGPIPVACGLVLSLALLCPGFLAARQAQARANDPEAPGQILEPNPELTPRQVIAAQLVGLQNAGDPDTPEDRGMRVVWNFAAPANQAVTGPFERFDAMVRAEPYAVLVGHHRHDIARLDQDPDRPVARALVAVADQDGSETWFVWILSQSAEGERAGCWVTDAVYPVDIEQDQPDLGPIV
ncbi:MAG: hypothetical protein AAGH99_02660 [Planctomycetota bacterium]